MGSRDARAVGSCTRRRRVGGGGAPAARPPGPKHFQLFRSPSANPPSAPPAVVKKPTGRRPGGQPGHPPPAATPARRPRPYHHVLAPTLCRRCQAPPPAEAGPDDPEPTWHQVAELPPGRRDHRVPGPRPHLPLLWRGHPRRHPRRGPGLKHRPAPGRRPGLPHGPPPLSKRAVEEVAEVVFGVPWPWGRSAIWSSGQRRPGGGARRGGRRRCVRPQVKHVDETGWKTAGRRCGCGRRRPGRSPCSSPRQSGGRGLEGPAGRGPHRNPLLRPLAGVRALAVGQRQLCWAHLKRDFQAMVDRAGDGAEVGAELLG